jgi:hypothetical protein
VQSAELRGELFSNLVLAPLGVVAGDALDEGDRPICPLIDFLRQNNLKPVRCQAMTVAVWVPKTSSAR